MVSFGYEYLPLPGAPWGWDMLKVMQEEQGVRKRGSADVFGRLL